jgi:hypothetical protein
VEGRLQATGGRRAEFEPAVVQLCLPVDEGATGKAVDHPGTSTETDTGDRTAKPGETE